jgi:hypothetical protein
MSRGDFVKDDISDEKKLASLENGKMKFYEIGVPVVRFEDANAVSIQPTDLADLTGIQGAVLNQETENILYVENNPTALLKPLQSPVVLPYFFRRR